MFKWACLLAGTAVSFTFLFLAHSWQPEWRVTTQGFNALLLNARTGETFRGRPFHGEPWQPVERLHAATPLPSRADSRDAEIQRGADRLLAIAAHASVAQMLLDSGKGESWSLEVQEGRTLDAKEVAVIIFEIVGDRPLKSGDAAAALWHMSHGLPWREAT